EAVHGLGLDMAGPVGQGGDAAATFKEHSLAFTIRAIVRGQIDLGYVRHYAGEHGATSAAVVAVKDDQGVFANPFFVERVHDAGDFVIQAAHHARIGVPRRVLDVFVAVDVFLGRLIRSVRRIEREIKIEGRGAGLLLDVIDGVGADQGGGITLFTHGLVVA